MTSSKNLKIAIPIIVVIAVGLFFGLSGTSFDNTKSKTDSTLDVEKENDVDLFTEDVNLQNSSTVSEAEEKFPRLVGEIVFNQSSNVIETVKEDQLLRKTTPGDYTFGNFFDNGLNFGKGLSILENSDQIQSIRFTDKHGGEINAITLSLLIHSEVEVIVGIQEDNGTGYPIGNWKNEESYVKTTVQPSESKYYFELPNSFQVSKGKVYHILIQMVPRSFDASTSQEDLNPIKTTSVMVLHHRDNTLYQPFNPEDPDIYWPDPAINSLQYDGENWIILDKWPTYLLNYTDGTVDGQPYTLKANWVLQEGRPVGQTIIPHSDYKVSKFAFLVTKSGNPADDLYYGIQDNNNNLLAGGLFVKSDELTKNLSFIEVSLDESINFKAGDLYRFYVYSPIPRGDDHYNLYGLEFSLNQTAGYGGEFSRLTTSSDFEHWGAWYDADAVFSLTTSK